MPKELTVYQEVIDAAKTLPEFVEPVFGDDKAEVINKLIEAINDVDEQVWQSLSSAAHTWYISAVTIRNNNITIFSALADSYIDSGQKFPSEDELARMNLGMKTMIEIPGYPDLGGPEYVPIEAKDKDKVH